MKKRLEIGAHIPTRGGLYTAFERADSIDCTTMQIFVKNNRQWNAKPLSDEAIHLFLEEKQKYFITPLVAHATYLINIGSPNKEVEEKSIACLQLELERCNTLGINYLVLHPGSHVNTDEITCLQRIHKNLSLILEKDTGKTTILLETMAGQGSTVCYTFDQLAYLITNSKHKKRLGVCFDTCHVFAAGYDISTEKKYNETMHLFDTIIGLKYLKVFHINDSKKKCGSRVDRHENIGKGKIWLEAFAYIFNDPRFFDIPKILETPKKSLEDDKKNMEIIIELLSEKTKKLLHVQ